MFTSIWVLSILIPIAYVIGSIPFGLIVGKSRGIDVRAAGSGNIGATNVGRLLGRKFFFAVFFLDLAKSFVPMLAASAIVWRIPESGRDRTIYLLWLLVGFAAVIGHMFSVFLKFRGGKGVATSAGMMLGLLPYYTLPGMLAIVVFILVFFPTRYVSLGSIISACSFPVLYFALGRWMGWPVTGAQLPLLIFACVLALMIVLKHRTNISRLLSGTENKFASKNAT
jgi:acyl phosphate:glycerol-3-phosphate acyltransferase